MPADVIIGKFGTDVAYQIAIFLIGYNKRKKESQIYFEEFVDFFKEHPDKFIPKIKQLILKTTDDIAAFFLGQTKSELIPLAKLRVFQSA